MSKTVDDLIGVYIEASNSVVWEAEKRGLCPMTLDMQRAGIAAVVSELMEHFVTGASTYAWDADDLHAEFMKILGDAGTATAGAIQPQGEAENGLRRSIEGPEGGAARGAFGLERQGDVPVPGERINLHREPPTASGNIPGRDGDRLPAPHRHEDGRQQVRAVVGVTDGPAGRGLGDSSLTEKVAGGSTREDEKAVEAAGDKGPVTVNSPATDPAPAVCEWTKRKYEPGFYATPHGIRYRDIPFPTCVTCGKPIKFTEAKT